MRAEILDDLHARIDALARQSSDRAIALGCVLIEADVRFHLHQMESKEDARRGAFVSMLVENHPKGLGSSEWKANAAYSAQDGHAERTAPLAALRGMLRTVNHLRTVAVAAMGRDR